MIKVSKKLSGRVGAESDRSNLVEDRLEAFDVGRALQVQRTSIVFEVDAVSESRTGRGPAANILTRFA
jgi:hypothetical protein